MAEQHKFREILESRQVVERLASIEHDRWAHWQRYIHAHCERRADGSLVIPPDLVARWERQIETAFVDLSEDEQESDRQQVREYLPVVIRALEDEVPSDD
ncbi:hypothetical protein [Arachnia propionica]|uniref:hypothetical protein n=1 Tax=Arachnia propionica TaxID=1750 RepID=UPI0028E1B5D8|nr:hypothetical protein [Arachnia propionica]